MIAKPIKCVTHHFACDCREEAVRELLLEIMAGHANVETYDAYQHCDIEPCDWCKKAGKVLEGMNHEREKRNPAIRQ